MFYFEKELNKLKKQYPQLSNVIEDFKNELLEVYCKKPQKATQLFIYFFLRNFFCWIKAFWFSENILDSIYYRMIDAESVKWNYNFFWNYNPPLDTVVYEIIKIKWPLHKTIAHKSFIKHISNFINKFIKREEISKKPYEDIHKHFLLEHKPWLKIYPYDKEKYRKIIFTTKEPEYYLEKTIKHYENFFWDIKNHKPNIFLTTSWMEANNTIAYFLEKTFWKDFIEKSYTPGWYMEKTIDIPKKYSKNTQILFIENLWEWLSIKNIKEELAFFIQQAKNNPHKDFYLVWDKTWLLDKENSEFIQELPENLKVFITSSLTKFQKWETNFFFWIIATYNLTEKEKEIFNKSYEHISFFKNSYLSKLFFPRLKKSYIKEYFKNIEKNKEVFIKWLWYIAEELILFENRISIFVKRFPKKLIKQTFIQQESFWFPYTNISPAFILKHNWKTKIMNRISFWTNLETDLEEKAKEIAKYYKENKELFGNIVF